jgi:hypothetical protein
VIRSAPSSAFFHSEQISPRGVNHGHYRDAEMESLLNAATSSFDETEQNRIMQRVQCKRKRWHLRGQAATLPENHLTRKAALPASSLYKLFWVIRLQEL